MKPTAKQDMRHRLQHTAIDEQFTGAWKVFLLLRRLGLKDIAYALFKNVVRSHVYVNGKYRGCTRIRRNSIVVHRILSPEQALQEALAGAAIPDPPPVPHSTH